MTRQEWIDDIRDLGELISWVRTTGEAEDIVEDIIDDDCLDEYVSDDIRNCDYGWRDLRDALYDIPQGYSWYRVNGCFDYVGLDDFDYETYKQQVLEELDNDGYFDPEDDDDEIVQDTVVPEEEPEVYDEPEIDEVDICGLENMSSVIWGIAGSAVEMNSFTTVSTTVTEPARVAQEEPNDLLQAVDPDDIFALPF